MGNRKVMVYSEPQNGDEIGPSRPAESGDTLVDGSGNLYSTGSGVGSGTPVGPLTSVQFNQAGAFSGSKNLVWEHDNSLLGVSGSITASQGVSASFVTASTYYGDGSNLTSISSVVNITGSILENVPMLVWDSVGIVSASAAPGKGSGLIVMMNNGAVYTATSPLTMNMGTSGLGGIEASDSEAADTWFYIYAVPSAVTGIFDVISTRNDPESGPDDYAIWKYIGAVRNDDGSDLLDFEQVGDWFQWIEKFDIGGLTSDGTYKTPTIDAMIPKTAGSVDLWFQQLASGDYTMALRPYGSSGSGLIHINNIERGGATLATPSTTKRIQYSVSVGGSGTIRVNGWHDEYLSPSHGGTVATVVENVPMLVYDSVGIVSASAAPGKSAGLAVTMNNGNTYTATSPLTMSMAVSGLGGIEASDSEAADTWFYIYAVPATAANTFHVVSTRNDPESGPDDYAIWKYVGAVRNDSGSDILDFFQCGRAFQYKTRVTITGTTIDGATRTLTIDAFIPKTSGFIEISLYIPNVGSYALIVQYTDGANNLRCKAEESTIGFLGVPGTTKQIEYTATNGSGALIYSHGWIDQYLYHF